MRAPWIKIDRFPGGAVLSCTACDAGGRLTGHAVEQFIEAHTDHTSPTPTHYGAGDVVARATQALGIKKCSGCEQRRVALNRAIPKIMKR